MKKIIAILMAAVMLLTFAACGEKEAETVSVSPLELLNKVWEGIPEDQRFYVIGGDYSEENLTENAPGTYSIADLSELDRALGFPEAEGGKVLAAASITHGMLANNFTLGAYQIEAGADMDALANTLVENIQARQWMCGFPERLLVAYYGDCLIGGFGLDEQLTSFETALKSAYPEVVIVSTAPIA